MAKKLNKILALIVLSAIIIISATYSIISVNASNGFNSKTTAWSGENNNAEANQIDTYPYNSTTAAITSVNLDVAYGISRGTVTYNGSVPFAQTRDSEGNPIEGWDGVYAYDNTDALADTNPTHFGKLTGTAASNYWGTGLTAENFATPSDTQKINDDNIISLRIWAKTLSPSGFKNFAFNAAKFITNLPLMAINLLIQLKNIDMNAIMEALHLDDLSKSLTTNFIYDSDHVKISAFTGFCIVILIFSLAAFAVRYVRGKDKTQGIWEILGTVGMGLLIIGMCLTGRITSLGGTLANAANQLMYVAVESMSTGSDGNAFVIQVSDPGNESKVVQMSEMAMLNKTYIDLQICNQFNVDSIDKLKFENFGDAGGTTAKSILSGVDAGGGGVSDINKNLGYYFWFADSNAGYISPSNHAIPDTRANAVSNKLSSIITYLQTQYNSGDLTRKSLIETIMQGFTTGSKKGAASMFILCIVCATLCISLFKFGLKIMVSKIELFIALIGMTVAGPLILSSKKNLVKIGKHILATLIVALMQITVYSIIFDICLYVISSIISPSVMSSMIALVLALILLKMSPKLNEEIDRLLENTTRAIAPEYAQNRRALANWGKRKVSGAAKWTREHTGEAVYDENGVEVGRKRGLIAGAVVGTMDQIENSTKSASARQSMRKAAIKTRDDLIKESNRADQYNAKQAHSDADKKIKERKAEENKIKDALNKEYENAKNSYKDATGKYNEEKLSEEQRLLLGQHEEAKKELDKITEENKQAKSLRMSYEVQLNALTDKIGVLTEDEQKERDKLVSLIDSANKRIQDYDNKTAELNNKSVESKKQLDHSIDESAKKAAFENTKDQFGSSIGSYDENFEGTFEEQMAKTAKNVATENHKDEINKALDTAIAMDRKAVDSRSRLSKIGKKGVNERNKLDREAAKQMGGAILQKEQLNNGLDISETTDAQKEVEKFVGKTETFQNGRNKSVIKAAFTPSATDKQEIEDAKLNLKFDNIKNPVLKEVAEVTTNKVVGIVANPVIKMKTAAKQTANRVSDAAAESKDVKGIVKNAKAENEKVLRRANGSEVLASQIKVNVQKGVEQSKSNIPPTTPNNNNNGGGGTIPPPPTKAPAPIPVGGNNGNNAGASKHAETPKDSAQTPQNPQKQQGQPKDDTPTNANKTIANMKRLEDEGKDNVISELSGETSDSNKSVEQSRLNEAKVQADKNDKKGV